MRNHLSPLPFSCLFTAICIAVSPIAVAALPLVDDFNDGNDYRFVFTLTGSVPSGQVFDLAAPGTPISTITGSDSTYSSGVTGLLVADASGTGTGTADATFDNFSLAVPEPSGAALALLGLAILIRRHR